MSSQKIYPLFRQRKTYPLLKKKQREKSLVIHLSMLVGDIPEWGIVGPKSPKDRFIILSITLVSLVLTLFIVQLLTFIAAQSQ